MAEGAGAPGPRRRLTARAAGLAVVAVGALAASAAIWWPRAGGDFRLPLRGRLDAAAAARLEAALDSAPRAALLVVDAEGDDTPAATTLLAAIERAQARGVRVAAFVEGRAHGWAALAVLACDAVYVHPAATLGRACPYRPDSDLDEATKLHWRTQAEASFEHVAARRRRNVPGARALVTNDMVLEGAEIVNYRLAAATCGSVEEAERRLGPAGSFGSR